MATVLPPFNPIAGIPQAIQFAGQQFQARRQRQDALADQQALLQFIAQSQRGGQPILPQFGTSQGAAQAASFIGSQPTEAQQAQGAATLDLTQAQAEAARRVPPVRGVSQGPGQQVVNPVTGEVITPPLPSLQSPSQTRLIGSIGEKIAAGTATKAETNVFNRLTETAGTEITINNIEDITKSLPNQISLLKSGQQLLNDFSADPENAEVLRNSDVNVVTNSKGQLQLEVKPKGPPAAAQIKELADIEGLLNSIGTIEALFDPSFVGIVEGSGALAKVSEATGLGTSTREVQFRRVTADLADRLLRARSGAQINEQEFKRLQNILPVPGLSEVAFLARLADFKREMSQVLATKQEAIRQAGQRPLGGQAPREVPIQIRGRTPQQEARLQELLRKAKQ